MWNVIFNAYIDTETEKPENLQPETSEHLKTETLIEDKKDDSSEGDVDLI